MDEIIKTFVREFLNDRKFQFENNFLIFLSDAQLAQYEAAWANPLQTPLGQMLLEMSRAAAGDLPDDPEGINRGVVYEGIQSLCELLFAPPGLGSAYTIPRSFWESEIGFMALQAFMWSKKDRLITATEAAEKLGVSLPAISQAVARGNLTGYADPTEPNPQRRLRLSEREVNLLVK